MMFPVACMSCGKLIGGLWDPYKEKIDGGQETWRAFVELGITRFCCKREFLTQIDLMRPLLVYSASSKA